MYYTTIPFFAKCDIINEICEIIKTLNKTFEFHSEKQVMHYEKLLEMIASELQKGNTVHLGAKGFDLFNEKGNNIADDIGGHAMTVLGINNDGNLVVNGGNGTPGNPYTLSLWY